MIFATAGHVDHGKTSLVRALTGVDTDRLAEEKARGLTIELGFAYKDTPNGGRIGFVDVPGHERFVHTMLAGAGGVDGALLVIAADDGVMPQTLEHLQILDLLGVSLGVVAISKSDRVDTGRLDAVMADVRKLLAGMRLAGADLIPVSAVTGAGVDALWTRLSELAAQDSARRASGPFRMPVDRAFTLAGAGLVLTGTAAAGRVRIGDTLAVMPGDATGRVRGIHALDQKTDEGRAGQRLGINIAGSGLDPRVLGRGHWLIAEGAADPSNCLDVLLRVPPGTDKPFAGRGRYHLHIGTADVMAETRLLSVAPIGPGEAGFVRLRTERPVVALWGDRAILRDASAKRTVAGVRVIDPAAPIRRRRGEDRLGILGGMAAENPEVALAVLLELPGGMVDGAAFARVRGLDPATLDDMVPEVVRAGHYLVASARLTALGHTILERLAEWHRAHPDDAGLARARALLRLPGDPPAVVAEAAADALVSEGAAVRIGAMLAQASHRAAFTAADAALWARIEPLLIEGGRVPPRVHEIAQTLKISGKVVTAFLRRAVRLGYLHPVAENRFFPPAALADLGAVAVGLGAFDARTYKEAAGIGRNLTIEVLEYFDTVGLTRREGDLRRVVLPVAEVFGRT